MDVFCVPCGVSYPPGQFRPSQVRVTSDGQRRSICKRCLASKGYHKRWRRVHKDRLEVQSREQKLRRKYGMSLEQFRNLENAQDSVCAVCLRRRAWRGTTDLVVDHCHDTGKVRGLLCHHCNTALGLVKDDVTRLQSAINYLTQSRRTDT